MPLADLSSPELSPRTQVLRGLRAYIRSGDVVRGEPLPSERALATRFRVDRKTVRRALDELAREGLIEELGERRPRIVREVSAGQAVSLLKRTIVLVSDVELRPKAFHLSQGWDTAIVLEALEAFQAQGYSVLAVHPDRFGETPNNALTALRPAGLMVMYGVAATPRGRELLDACRSAGTPCVVYGDLPEHSGFDRVHSDHHRGSYELTRHLIGKGCKRIVRFWRMHKTPRWLEQREAGYLQAMSEAGLEAPPPIRTPELSDFSWTHSHTASDFQNLARVLLGFLYDPMSRGDAPDALMTATDPHALQVSAALRLLGKTPGVDVQVVGYDNTYRDLIEWQWEKTPPSATVDKNNAAIAREMALLLVARIEGRLPDQPQCRAVEPRLLVTQGLHEDAAS